MRRLETEGLSYKEKRRVLVCSTFSLKDDKNHKKCKRNDLNNIEITNLFVMFCTPVRWSSSDQLSQSLPWNKFNWLNTATTPLHSDVISTMCTYTNCICMFTIKQAWRTHFTHSCTDTRAQLFYSLWWRWLEVFSFTWFDSEAAAGLSLWITSLQTRLISADL